MALNPSEFVKKFEDRLKTRPDDYCVKGMRHFLEENQRFIVKETAAISGHLKRTDWAEGVFHFLEHVLREESTSTGRNVQVLVQARTSMYRALRNLSSDSPELRPQLTERNIPEVVGKDLANLQEFYQINEDVQLLVEYGLSLIHNIACSKNLCSALHKQTYRSLLAYVDPKVNDMNRVITAVQLIELINPDNHLCEYFYPESLFITLSDLIGRAFYSKDEHLYRVHFRTDNTGTATGADYVLICLIVLCRAKHYQCRVLDIIKERQKRIQQFLKSGGQFEQKRTVELLKVLAKHICSRCLDGRFALMFLEEHGLTDHEEEEEEPLSHQRPVKGVQNPSFAMPGREKTVMSIQLKKAGAKKGKGCLYADACRRYLRSIGISERYINDAYDKCFCRDCIKERGDKSLYERGKPPAASAIPAGWAKFALRMPVRADILNIWEDYHVAYHGTRPCNLSAILETGDLLMPGDKNPNGDVIQPPWGHYREDWKPKKFDVKQFFLSPSIIYAGKEAYAAGDKYKDPVTGIYAKGRVAIQVRIKPNTYEVSAETLQGGSKRLDPLFDNDKLEWTTNHRGVLFLTGILARLENETK